MESSGHRIDRFTLSVNMVNEATDNPLDVAEFLDKITGRIRLGVYTPGATSSIIDRNGNRVGSWKFHLEGVE